MSSSAVSNLVSLLAALLIASQLVAQTEATHGPSNTNYVGQVPPTDYYPEPEPMYHQDGQHPEHPQAHRPIHAHELAQGAPKPSRLSKLPVAGRIFYNPYQKELHQEMKLEKQIARDTKHDLKQVAKQTPPVRLGRKKVTVLPFDYNEKVKLMNDAKNNARVYKDLIKNKP